MRFNTLRHKMRRTSNLREADAFNAGKRVESRVQIGVAMTTDSSTIRMWPAATSLPHLRQLLGTPATSQPLLVVLKR